MAKKTNLSEFKTKKPHGTCNFGETFMCVRGRREEKFCKKLNYYGLQI